MSDREISEEEGFVIRSDMEISIEEGLLCEMTRRAL